MRRRILLTACFSLLLSGLVLMGPAPPSAAGGGSWLEPVLDRYSPGEVATLVAYASGNGDGWVDDGPFEAYLRADPDEGGGDEGTDLHPGAADSDIPLGPLVLQETGRGGVYGLWVSLTFTVPDLAPGEYGIGYCNADCTPLGTLIVGSIWVDVDPPHPTDRDWPADDPARDGAAADAPLPPPPPTTLPATTVAPTTAPTTTMREPSTSRASVPPPSTFVAERVVTSPGQDGSEGGGPGLVLLGLGAAVVALAVGAGLQVRHGDTTPSTD